MIIGVGIKMIPIVGPIISALEIEINGRLLFFVGLSSIIAELNPWHDILLPTGTRVRKC